MSEHKGTCFCGAVHFTVRGEPSGMGYCHCESCRHWSAGPVNAFSLWKRDALEITQGAEQIGTHNKTPVSSRKWCRSCGGHLFNDHPTFDLVDVFAALIPTLRFQPAIHVNYGESVLRMKDGLRKMKDFPTDLGGSGETMPE